MPSFTLALLFGSQPSPEKVGRIIQGLPTMFPRDCIQTIQAGLLPTEANVQLRLESKAYPKKHVEKLQAQLEEVGGRLVEVWRMKAGERDLFSSKYLSQLQQVADFGAAAGLIQNHLKRTAPEPARNRSKLEKPAADTGPSTTDSALFDFGTIDLSDSDHKESESDSASSEPNLNNLELEQTSDSSGLELDLNPSSGSATADSSGQGVFSTGHELDLESEASDESSEEEILEPALLEDPEKPASVDAEKKNRRSERFDVSLDVEFKTELEFVREHATNISKGGIFVQSRQQPPIDSEVVIRIKLPNGETLTTEARVVHVREDSSPGIGLEFKNDDSEFSIRLRTYFSSLKRKS